MGDLENSKSTNRLGIIRIGIVVFVVICLVIWQKYFSPTLAEEVFKEALPLTFHGKVDSVYRDERNHNVKKVILSDGHVYGIYAPWESMVDIGDSLSKAKGDLKMEVYKKNGVEVILDYRQLAKGFKKAWWQR